VVVVFAEVHVDEVLQMPAPHAQGHAGLRAVRSSVLRDLQGQEVVAGGDGMKVHELIERLQTLPPDAHVTADLKMGEGLMIRGVLALWEDDARLYQEFIVTPLLPAGMTPASPKRAKRSKP
jgi:hypothetical protein